MNLAGKKVSDRRERGSRLRRADEPLAFHARLRLVRFRRLAGKHADERIIRRLDFLRLIRDARPLVHGLGHGVNHVGLARAQPHFADDDILKHQRSGTLGASDAKRTAFARRLERREIDAPVSSPIDAGRYFLRAKLDRHVFARVRRAPDGNRAIALQHHARGERTRELHRGLRCGGQTQKENEG
jgi:hypothetical protein